MDTVYVVHYYDMYEVTICGSFDTAIEVARNYITNTFDGETQAEILGEFEKSIKENDGWFDVEDVVWVTDEPFIP